MMLCLNDDDVLNDDVLNDAAISGAVEFTRPIHHQKTRLHQRLYSVITCDIDRIDV